MIAQSGGTVLSCPADDTPRHLRLHAVQVGEGQVCTKFVPKRQIVRFLTPSVRKQVRAVQVSVVCNWRLETGDWSL